MRPPICAICKKDFRKDPQSGGTVKFKTTEKEAAQNEKMKNKRMLGHPAGLEWFCKKHIKIAERYKNLTWKEAYPKILKSSNFWTRVLSIIRR